MKGRYCDAPSSVLRVAFVALLALLFVAACDRGPKMPRLAPDAIVLAFGDSLTYGTGASEAESYPAQLAQLIRRNVVRAGVPGEISADGLRRLPEALDELKPQLLILCHGGNDMLRKLSDDELTRNLRAMIGLARERNIAVLLVAVPRPGLFLSGAESYARIAGETGVPVEEKALAKILGNNALKSDLIHPNAAGYRKLAESIAERLRKSGAIE